MWFLRPHAAGPEDDDDGREEEFDEKTAATKDDLRVLLWREQSVRFDAMAAACHRLKVNKTTLLNEGIALTLAKHGGKTPAKLFKMKEVV